jgi:hypothetical protein
MTNDAAAADGAEHFASPAKCSVAAITERAGVGDRSLSVSTTDVHIARVVKAAARICRLVE